MTAATYDFDIETRWIFRTTPEELTAIILDPDLLDRWCPTVVLKSELLNRGRADGMGLAMKIHTKGWLPHSFYFTAEIVDLLPHRRMTIRVEGDFEGQALMSVEPLADEECLAIMRWMVDIPHPLIRPLVRPFHPVFVRNHRWAMSHAHGLLQREIDRRRAGADAFATATATFPHNIAWFRRTWKRKGSVARGTAHGADDIEAVKP